MQRSHKTKEKEFGPLGAATCGKITRTGDGWKASIMLPRFVMEIPLLMSLGW